MLKDDGNFILGWTGGTRLKTKDLVEVEDEERVRNCFVVSVTVLVRTRMRPGNTNEKGDGTTDKGTLEER